MSTLPVTSQRSTAPLDVMSTFTDSTMSRNTSLFLYLSPSRRQLTAPVTCMVALRDSWARLRRSKGASSLRTPSCVMYSFSASGLRIWG